MENLTIDQIRVLKHAAESQITTILSDFQNKTNCKIDNVRVDFEAAFGTNHIVYVEIKVVL